MKMRVQKLPPLLTNFQVGYIPDKLLTGNQEGNVRVTTTPASPAVQKETSPPPPPQVQFIGVSLKSRNRRLILRRSLSSSPDVSTVLPCDLRVQQLVWTESPENEPVSSSRHHSTEDEPVRSSGSPNRRKETVGTRAGSESSCQRSDSGSNTGGRNGKYADYYGDVMSQEDEDDVGRRREGVGATVEGGEQVGTSGRKGNDYRREIDLAHHILQMEQEEDDHDDKDGYSRSSGAGGEGKMSIGEHPTTTTTSLPTPTSTAPLFQCVPSTMRFNDALVCTSKDVQILKSGAIKMMRLTVICHSDLHYYKNHHSASNGGGGEHPPSQSQKYFGNETAPKEETDAFTNASKPATTTTYSSSSSSSSTSFSTSSVQVTGEKEDGKCERKPSTPTRQVISHENVEKEKRESREEKKGEQGDIMLSKVSSSSYHPIHHDSNQETDSTQNLSECKTNWKRLGEKIRLIFQTYDVHVGSNCLVNLKNCPLASFQTAFSPGVRFLFVEECEIMKNNKKTDTAAAAAQPPPDIGKVSGRTEIIITNVHHISYYERIVEMEESSVSEHNVHLYGLEHAAKILNGMIKTSGGGGVRQVENPVVPVTYTGRHGAPSSSSGLLTEFSHGLLISGPSGCGKVVVVRETAKKLGAHLLSFNPSSGGVEDSSSAAPSRFCQLLTDIFTSALATASRYQTVLLFPRIHLLFQKDTNSPSSARNNNRARLLHHLCKLFDSIPAGFPLTVVGTTDKAFLVPMQLRRAGRLEKEVIISPPKESERLAIFQELSRRIPSFQNVDFTQFASQTPGYVAQDLLKVLRLALFKCQEEAEDGKAGQVSEEHMRYAIRRVVPSVLEGALGVVDIQRTTSLDHIAGLHSVKLDLIKAIVWPLKHPEAFLRMGISPPKGILLYGPPGNAKTTLVRAVAATHQTNFLSVSAAELFSSGVGDSEKIVAHLFHRARMASPCILFIDELESIVGSRQSSEKKQTGTNESILSMLLTEMDGVGTTRIHHHQESSSKISHSNDDHGSLSSAQSLGPLVLVVAATNRPDLIDPALLRPGRFDKLIGVPPLDLTGRVELLEWCSKSIPFDKDVDFMQVGRDTEYFSGADLVNLCREAALFALSDSLTASFVTEKHVKLAMSVVSPSLSSGIVRAFHEYGSSLHQQR